MWPQEPIGHAVCVLFSVVQTIGHSSLLDMLCVCCSLLFKLLATAAYWTFCVCILLWLAQQNTQECKYFWSVFFFMRFKHLISYMCVRVYVHEAARWLCVDVSWLVKKGSEKNEGKGRGPVSVKCSLFMHLLSLKSLKVQYMLCLCCLQ